MKSALLPNLWIAVGSDLLFLESYGQEPGLAERRAEDASSTAQIASGESDEMTTTGDVIENPVTGGRAVVRIGTRETAGAHSVVDIYVRPGGAVVGEHWHPEMDERFTVLRGRVGFRVGGQERTADLVAESWTLTS